MALTAAQQAQVDRLKGIAPSEGKSDEELSELITSEGTINLAASYLWTAEAKSTATLIDVSEGSSRRSLSIIHKNAVAMATFFGDKVEAEAVVTAGRTTTRRISRA